MKSLIILLASFLAILVAIILFVFLQYPKAPIQTVTTGISLAVATSTIDAPKYTVPKNYTHRSPATYETTSTPVKQQIKPNNIPKYTSVQKTYTTSTKPAIPPTPTLTNAQLQAKLAASALRIRDALVNIICVSSSNGLLRSISGSGIIIDPRGIILTNAHIAQYFLLKDYPSHDATICTIRTGNPARPAYKASPIFISPKWITANQTAIIQRTPTGTGKYDIALLAITKSDTPTKLPDSFPYIPLAVHTPTIGAPIVIGSYAAQFLSMSEIQFSLYSTIVYGNIQKVFTFATSTIDMISLGGTAAAQEGSSGGGIVDTSGKLIGMVTTSTIKGVTSDRDLSAITASYIRRDYVQEMHRPLDTISTKSPSEMVTAFVPESLRLKAILIRILSAH